MPAGASDKTNGVTEERLDLEFYSRRADGSIDVPIPFAFAGALARHVEHSFDEHGISCLR